MGKSNHTLEYQGITRVAAELIIAATAAVIPIANTVAKILATNAMHNSMIIVPSENL